MKAIFRWSVGLFGLLFLSSFAHAYYWVTPVTRCPYPVAPSPCNSGFYLMDAYGRWTGPHYYLMPPTQPFNGFRPGPVGSAIMSGNLPHPMLLKDATNIGNMPMINQGKGNGIFNFGGGGQNPGSMPPAQNPGFPYATSSAPPMQMQMVPYGAPPTYNAGMSPYQMMAPGQMPYPGQVPARPVAWQGQGQPSPFGPIPSFNGQGPQNGLPPLSPMPPMGPMAPPMPPYPQFNPMQPFSPMQPPMAPMPPQPNMTPMQMPRLDYMPPPAPPKTNAFPMHPFTRSPRDFFMWGENMEDEARMRNRPFPVPR